MILFIFEGAKREVDLFDALNKCVLKLSDQQKIICVYDTNIYSLYDQIKKNDDRMNAYELLKDLHRNEPNYVLNQYLLSDISETYLFFDYDPQHHVSDEEPNIHNLNKNINVLLNFFDDETSNGKLYISYPMVDSIFYSRELPDKKFHRYNVKYSKLKCHDFSFKEEVNKFSRIRDRYKALELDKKSKDPKKELGKVENNWKMICHQNISKANFICNDSISLPEEKSSIAQNIIFMKQQIAVTKKNRVFILNAFPLFIYDYLKESLNWMQSFTPNPKRSFKEKILKKIKQKRKKLRKARFYKWIRKTLVRVKKPSPA